MLKDYFVYIIECSSGRLYTGYAVNLEKRFNEHLSGKNGAKFTRAFKPHSIAASWKIVGERGDAMRVEAFIKSLTKKEKTDLTRKPDLLIERFNMHEDFKNKITVYDYKGVIIGRDN